MLQLSCPAVWGNLELCLMVCPHNSHLEQMTVPTCDVMCEAPADDDEVLVCVVEEENS